MEAKTLTFIERQREREREKGGERRGEEESGERSHKTKRGGGLRKGGEVLRSPLRGAREMTDGGSGGRQKKK